MVQDVKTQYETFIRPDPQFADDPVWEDDVIEEHLFVHEAGLASQRGESMISYVLEDLLIVTRHSLKHMFNKETGMPDPQLTKNAMGWYDRLLKADGKCTTAMAQAQKKERRRI